MSKFINNHIETDLHTKPRVKHQYLLKTSCHPNYTKNAIPICLFLRIRRICSADTFFDQRSRELIEYRTKHGYSRTSLQRDANSVHSIPRHTILQPQEQKSDRTPFVTSFNPALPKISSVVNKYITLLQSTANYKKALPNPPAIAYRLRTKIPLPANDLQELKNATSHAASPVLFSQRVKQTILFLQPTKQEMIHRLHILPLKNT